MAGEKVPSTSLSENCDPHVRFRTLRSKFSCRLVSGTFSATNTIRKGFTLIEILVVIAIMAVLFVLTLTSFSGYRQEAILKLTEGSIISSIAEAKLKVSQGKQGQDSKLVCFGVLLEKDKEGITFLQWPYSSEDFYENDGNGSKRKTGKCEPVDAENSKAVKESKPFQEKVIVKGLFVDDSQQSEALVRLVFEPPQGGAIVYPKAKELRVVLQTSSGIEREFSLDLVTGNIL